MTEHFPRVYLARHGETAWSSSGRHTGSTDIALTEAGERNARRLEERLQGTTFARVLTSPLQRASRTCELAGFAARGEVDADLVEWDYGRYEGRTTAQIHAERPGWEVFRDGCPDGEGPEDVARRADRVVAELRASGGDVLVFSHGHFLRVLAARWLGIDTGAGRALYLDTAALCIVGYEHGLDDPVIRLWNDCRHTGG
jgi:probable phosphoglycerate mutase